MKTDSILKNNMSDTDAAVERLVFQPADAYLVSAGVVVPEAGREMRPGWLLIERGRVTDAGAGGRPGAADVIHVNRPELMLIPGLIDAHVHLGLDPKAGKDIGPVGRAERAARAGMVAVRDGGDRLCGVLEQRRELERFVRLNASGAALYRPGRYGSFLGWPVADRRDMAKAVKDMLRLGAEQVKVLASGPVDLSRAGRTGRPQFSRDELAYLADLAHVENRPVMAHANGPEAVAMCARAGVASVEHGYFMGEEAMGLLRENGVAWVPTVEPLAALLDRESDEAGRRIIRQTIDHQLGQLAAADAMGVELVTGTDAGSPGVEAGPALYREMSWWLRAGVPAERVLSAATTRAARLLGRQEELGRLVPRRLAFMAGYPAQLSLDAALTGSPVFLAGPYQS